jgi:hypothetical protein
MEDTDMYLEKIRDPGMPTYTYFFKIGERIVSPYFNSEQEAIDWKHAAN